MEVDGDTVIIRKLPFTKKPFRVTKNGNGQIVEWTTADEAHQEIFSYDQYSRLTKVRNFRKENIKVFRFCVIPL